jgi:putative tricarboxylic transport membrane protein
MLLVLNLPLIRLWVLLLKIPRRGFMRASWSLPRWARSGVNPSPVELTMLVLFGVMGY